MKRWNELSMSEKVPYMKLALDSGITDLNMVQNVYNKYAEGGDMEAPPIYLKRPESNNYNYKFGIQEFKPTILNEPVPTDNTTYKVLSRDPNQYFRQKASEVASFNVQRNKNKKAIQSLKIYG